MVMAKFMKQQIGHAAITNPSLKPSEVARGIGLPVIPSAVDSASAHLGKISREMKKARECSGLTSKQWSPTDFEEVANEIDEADISKSADSQERIQIYKRYGRPYLVAAGIEDGIKFIFTMTPLMAKIAAVSEFIQTDITYNDESREYPYLFNAVAFDQITMEYTVIARVRLSQQSAEAYALSFRKIIAKCKADCPEFEIGTTLLGIMIDWSDAEIKGLHLAVGKKQAEELLKGCKVHWLRSCQRVADRVSSSPNKQLERRVFLEICRKIKTLDSRVDVVACFESLCGVRSVSNLLQKLPSLCTIQEATIIDEQCNWSVAKHWAQWWTRATHLKMLSQIFSDMSSSVWNKCPSSTNAVERKNKDCKSDKAPLKLAMISVYKLDKLACFKHMAAEEGTSISYRRKTEEARKANAEARQRQRMKVGKPDHNAEHGPPDRVTNFNMGNSRKRKASEDKQCTTLKMKASAVDKTANSEPASKEKRSKPITVENSKIQFTPNTQPEVMGRRVKMKFQITDTDTEETFEGVIASYNGMTGKFGVYFPSDGETVDVSLSDDNLEIID